ncbi:hypothetical protein P3342_009607 [Pyrenophora teres f. teres]|uniref:Uncharacterized protein n=2 Tax=Pyrenophora teres f. teres TaxID=97479 RepID=E3RD65_PYRTT|nr:hypothetical protein PTT_01688 [Pyrenophora teres f. teres 0-1]KAE8825655.1 hypothetical protein HRS9139_08765 [Pyrenophora teres f. teres]KAE8834752.1 hypothetical protein PTNB85_06085 [Pyrenophora teres f. teres]KAE8843770.1 hypothetical protein HRS9122_04873 [Pyrenophora teres f. teres]KAE8859172.1 hypothetical protein PTNB73_08652 [Pyrenophora teres f. teres]
MKTFFVLFITSATALAAGPKPLDHQCLFTTRGCLGVCSSQGPDLSQQFCEVTFEDESKHQYPCGTNPRQNTCVGAPETTSEFPYNCRAYSELEAATICGLALDQSGISEQNF